MKSVKALSIRQMGHGRGWENSVGDFMGHNEL